MIELSVIVPTYNERPNVGELIRRLGVALQGIRWEAVFVDDDSPDGTAAEVRAAAQADPRVRCVQRLGRRGLSRAVVEGVLSTAAPVIAVIDADLQHDESILPAMLARLRGTATEAPADVVVGSRYVAGGGLDGWDAQRERMSRFATALANRMVATGLSDPMSGFFMMKRETFDLAVRRLSGEGYKLLLDLLASLPTPPRVAEIPYTFRPRRAGESKLDSAVLWEFSLLLIDKKFGRWIPARFLLFSMVGISGVAVHFAVLTLLYQVAHLAFTASQATATLVAMTSNYALNNSFTYRDQRHRGLSWWRGLLTFYAICGFGVIANVGVAGFLFERQGWALAAAAGALVGTGWNYAATRAVTWRSR
ncbi:glycosyltransferase [Scleromatobacter humisilvae]|uniref:Glycosyltransferase family 2 protein n=1 Tax=Scleromatobacter humisilvae TaxID=2897159 RepID=A0A9X1YPS4_9BURK|nr:glycosyltransferase family 2 protein [Scleromatobacter humisilvae]MCK9689610.1 glycosyltransferase family 2 protein [Scleromatobacter humisilvae]